MLWLAVSLTVARAQNENESATIWYPFLKGSLWGYIDAQGTWKISPGFESVHGVFDGPRAAVFEKGKWGFIDRSGAWVIPPIYTDIDWRPSPDIPRVLTLGKKNGILGRGEKIELEIRYDEISLAGDRAWVRSGDKLGLFAVDRGWVVRPSLKWPRKAELPYPFKSDGVAWFRRGKRWGLLSTEGKVLFAPRFAAHELDSREAEEWDRPDGLDFKNGRAWVREQDRWLLIDNVGRELGRFDYDKVAPWSDESYRFTDKRGQRGLVSRDGAVILPAQFAEIRDLEDGMAIVIERHERTKPSGEKETNWTYGAIDAAGKITVPCGKYGQDLGPYSHGLARASRNVGGEIHDPRAGYIDRAGNEAIAFDYYRTDTFSDGLGAVLSLVPLPGFSPKAGLWGFVDTEGRQIIPPQFGAVTSFCKGRAWAVQAGHQWDSSAYALIDRSGTALTEWRFRPPEREHGSQFPENQRLLASRWRGDLVVISAKTKLGLATADGRILIEPRFNTIREFKSGMAAACEWDGKQSHCGFVNEAGELVIAPDYSDGRDFDGDVAWVTRRAADSRGRYKDNGWLLIDQTGKLLTEDRYLGPNWAPATDYHGTPSFVGDLACVAIVDTYDVYAKNPAQRASWGYINRAGKRVSWHEPTVAEASRN